MSKLGCAIITCAFITFPLIGAKPHGGVGGPPVLWQDPVDISSRNLLYGIGSKERQPRGPFTFVKEDLDGTNPKFVVTGADGVKWKVKLGVEARPETAATRLVWAAGYETNEDYFLPVIQVQNLPPHLTRGQSLERPDGSFENVRLKRDVKKEEEKTGSWKWRENPFTGTREFNGLRVMMALINNWDLKDINNSTYRKGDSTVYVVSDLGASFGATHLGVSHDASKGNLHAYSHSTFISDVKDTYVNFDVPNRPALLEAANPHEFFSRVDMRWIGKHVPREDARWIGTILGKLSPDQIRDAFRAAGYPPEDVEAFAEVVEHRIADLKKL